MANTWKRITNYFAGESTDKFFKISLLLLAVSVACWVILSVLASEPLLSMSFSGCASLWLGGHPMSEYCVGAMNNLTWVLLVLLGIGYVIATITGLVAMYQAIKTHHKWWTVITIYAVVLFSPVVLIFFSK